MVSKRGDLICSVNRGLWGEVGPNFRVVTAKVDSFRVCLRFYIDGEPSEEDLESAGCVGTEVIADYPEHDLSEEVIRCDAPEGIVVEDGWLLIFQRRENQ